MCSVSVIIRTFLITKTTKNTSFVIHSFCSVTSVVKLFLFLPSAIRTSTPAAGTLELTMHGPTGSRGVHRLAKSPHSNGEHRPQITSPHRQPGSSYEGIAGRSNRLAASNFANCSRPLQAAL